jgi:uncharacterized membrane protein
VTNPIDTPSQSSPPPQRAAAAPGRPQRAEGAASDHPLWAVRLMHRVEGADSLDALGSVLSVVARAVTWQPLGSVLRGAGTGHAVHPVLTDLPIGLWTSATVLDIAGGERSRGAARLLTGLGLVTVLPTAASGLAEWAQTTHPEARVGSLHAALNLGSVGGFAASFVLRGRGHHKRGAAVALLAMTVASAAGYLGGHLTTVRKTGTRDAAFERDGVGPVVRRPIDG